MPCYGCLRVVPSGQMPFIDDISEHGIGCVGALERRCKDCDGNDGKAFETLLDKEVAEWEMKLDNDHESDDDD